MELTKDEEGQARQTETVPQSEAPSAPKADESIQRVKTELDDIIDFDDAQTENGDESIFTFKKFKDQTEIAQNIATVLFNKKYNRRGTKGFYNTELTRAQVGLLTHCLGLQTVASLSQLGLDLSQYADKINDTINAILGSLRVSEKVYQDLADADAAADPMLLNFNMTPYISDILDDAEDSQDAENDGGDAVVVKSCVESAANVLKALSEIREALFRQKERYSAIKLNIRLWKAKDDTVAPPAMEVLERIIRYTLGWLCGACIPAMRSDIIYKINGQAVYQDPDKNLVKSLGWNFFRNPKTDGETYEPSLYMTYSVCSAYMSIASSIREERKQIASVLKKTGKIAIEDVTEATKRLVSETAEKLKALSISEKQKSNFSFYAKIYRQFETFRRQCIDAGRYEEMQCKNASIDLASKFIGQNFTSVDYGDIENSTTNDSVINTVFHVLVLLYSGIDLDYEAAVKRNIVSDGEFYDEMQYALQNVMRRWKSLNKDGKSYIIDTYTLSFKERMPVMFADWIKQLRRQRIQVASLLPILIRAFNEVSRYLVRYPQKQNIEYLALVLQNRSERDGVKEWAWDLDGYNLNSECYFVKELVDFYEYYTTYEEPFLRAGDKTEDFVFRFKKEYDFRKSDFEAEKTKAVSDLRAEKDAEIAKRDELIKKLQSQTAPLVKEIKALIREEFRENLNGILKSMLSETDSEGSTKALFSALVLDSAFNCDVNGTKSLFKVEQYEDYRTAKDRIEDFVQREMSKYFNGKQ